MKIDYIRIWQGKARVVELKQHKKHEHGAAAAAAVYHMLKVEGGLLLFVAAAAPSANEGKILVLYHLPGGNTFTCGGN